MYSVSTPYIAALLAIPGLGSERVRRLIEHCGSAEAAWRVNVDALTELKLPAKIIASLESTRNNTILNQWKKIMEMEDIRAVSFCDDDYPNALNDLARPPLILYVRGQWPIPSQSLVTIVGTRDHTRYGEELTRIIVGELAANGIGIVSGLAFGIDATAHRTTLAAKGYTLAVLGSGVDQKSVTPVEHQQLAKDIIASAGTLLSAYPPGMAAEKYHFPERNNILAALSQATLVIEAGANSGALITAHAAHKMGRVIGACPGPITSPQSKGANLLIKKRIAHMVENGRDVLALLGKTVTSIDAMQQRPIPNRLSELEKKLLTLLANTPMHVDALARALEIQTPVVNTMLVTLELSGFVRDLGGGRYTRS